jgi:hypothetical protein
METLRVAWALLLALALANFSAWAAAGAYHVEPYTAQQISVDDAGTSHPLTERFLTLMLSDVGGNAEGKYEHSLPSREDSIRPVALKAKPRSLFEGSLARRHPFEPSLTRILMYWGCGQQTGKGQPKVIKRDALNDEQLTRLLAPSPRSSDSSGGLEQVSRAERLVAYYNARMPERTQMHGTHELRSDSTRTRFTVGEEGEFLPAVTITQVRVSDAGDATIRWDRTGSAVAYFANLYIQRMNSADVIIWTSSRIPEAGYLLSQAHPGADEVLRLRNKGVLMHKDAQECTIPSAVIRHAAHAMAVQVHAFGPETVIAATSSELERPSTTVRVVPRATTTILLFNPNSSESGDARVTGRKATHGSQGDCGWACRFGRRMSGRLIESRH